MSGTSVVVELADLPSGGMRALQVEGHALLVGRAGDAWFAIENRCPHVGIPLEGGRLEGSVLECPLHGGKLDVRTGAVVAPPIRRPARTYPVHVVDGGLRIEIG